MDTKEEKKQTIKKNPVYVVILGCEILVGYEKVQKQT